MALLTPYPWQTAFWTYWQSMRNHAYLFMGIPGWGKKHLATCIALHHLKIYPTTLENFAHPQYRVIPPKASIDNVRDVLAFTEQTATQKVVVIEALDTLSIPAQQALLKHLEEPLGNLLWLLLSNTSDTLLPTILSRCQVVRVPKVTVLEALSWLKPQYPQKTEALLKQALQLAQGGPLNAFRWIENEIVWKTWLEELLIAQMPTMLSKDTWDDFRTLWLQLLLDVSYQAIDQPARCVLPIPSAFAIQKSLSAWTDFMHALQQDNPNGISNVRWMSTYWGERWRAFLRQDAEQYAH